MCASITITNCPLQCQWAICDLVCLLVHLHWLLVHLLWPWVFLSCETFIIGPWIHSTSSSHTPLLSLFSNEAISVCAFRVTSHVPVHCSALHFDSLNIIRVSVSGYIVGSAVASFVLVPFEYIRLGLLCKARACDSGMERRASLQPKNSRVRATRDKSPKRKTQQKNG